MTENNIIIQQDFNLKPFNSFAITSIASWYCPITQAQQLSELLGEDSWRNNKLCILGGGSNILFTENFAGLVLHMQNRGIETVKETENTVWLRFASGEPWHDCVEYCVAHRYYGIENLALIPGSMGAAPMQNIGAYGCEIKQVLDSLTAYHVPSNTFKTLDAQECGLDYRTSFFKTIWRGDYIITDVTLKLSKQPDFTLTYPSLNSALSQYNEKEITANLIKTTVIDIRRSKLPDPTIIPNAGSFFKNPVISIKRYSELSIAHPHIPHFKLNTNQVKIPAAWLIEQCGFKGKNSGNVGVHDKQALVLVNYGDAEGKDVVLLAKAIQTRVLQRFNISLTPEVNIL